MSRSRTRSSERLGEPQRGGRVADERGGRPPRPAGRARARARTRPRGRPAGTRAATARSGTRGAACPRSASTRCAFASWTTNGPSSRARAAATTTTPSGVGDRDPLRLRCDRHLPILVTDCYSVPRAREPPSSRAASARPGRRRRARRPGRSRLRNSNRRNISLAASGRAARGRAASTSQSSSRSRRIVASSFDCLRLVRVLGDVLPPRGRELLGVLDHLLDASRTARSAGRPSCRRSPGSPGCCPRCRP